MGGRWDGAAVTISADAVSAVRARDLLRDIACVCEG